VSEVPDIGAIRPTPELDEAAAIVAALDAAWPRAVSEAPVHEMARWRFSGRWWTKPLPTRRDRP
jgi:hypothetical protein